jgi:trehalose 6-phosphate synthase
VSGLVVVANRGPSLRRDADGAISIGSSAGGLAPSLFRAMQDGGGRWVSAALTETERAVAQTGLPREQSGGIDLSFIDLPPAVFTAAYNVIANGTLWFLFHQMFDTPRRPIFDKHWHEAWACYRRYNQAFADEVVAHAAEGATVVVNDYHLCLLGPDLAARRPDLKTVFFCHTPFCPPEVLAVLPAGPREELVRGLSGFGASGFHVPRWARAFAACAQQLDLAPQIFAAPLGVDQDELIVQATTPDVTARYEALLARLDGRQIVARVDRAELSKNLIRGFLAFGELLDAEPRRRGRVRFVARVYPSRTDLAEYLGYQNEVQQVVERLNARYGEGDDAAIELEVEDDFAASLALLSAYDALLVNPIRDGMNLVAKEGPTVNRRDGALLLSREAGAFDELEGAAYGIDPFDVSGTAAALAAALDAEPTARAARAVELRKRSGGLAPARWLEAVISHARRPGERPAR